MVVTKENMNDIVPLSKLGKECGVDYFVVNVSSPNIGSTRLLPGFTTAPSP